MTSRLDRRTWPSRIAALLAGAVQVIAYGQAAQDEYVFHRTNLLGTSVDVRVIARSRADAQSAADEIFNTIIRLDRLLSPYRENSDLWRLNHTSEAIDVAPETLELLNAYATWRHNTHGAVTDQLGLLATLWKRAAAENRLPDRDALSRATSGINDESFEIDPDTHRVKRTTQNLLNIDALGKSFILDKSLAAAREKCPSVIGMLVDIGGDIRVSGWASAKQNKPWLIGVADPARPQENGAKLTALEITDLAVVTSGSYERAFTIQGARYSHILDPRTGQPVKGIKSVTVIAADGVTANALATAICVMGTADGLALVAKTPGAQCLIVSDDGKETRSDAFGSFERGVESLPAPLAAASQPASVNAPWPAGFEAEIKMQINPMPTKQNLRPYLAVWIQDMQGNHVRTLEVWSHPKKLKYLRDLTSWWKFGQKDDNMVKAVTRATRQAGQYAFVWDGRDQSGKSVPAGQYQIFVEVAYEDGDHNARHAEINCGKQPTTATLENCETFQNARISYRKHE